MHPASAAVTLLELFFHDVSLGHATGFLYHYGQTLALVSNWHVFSGRNPLTSVISSSQGFVPNRVTFHVAETVHDEDKIGFFFRGLEAQLSIDGQPTWWQHKGYPGEDGKAHLVDIGVLPLNDVIENYEEKRRIIQSFSGQVLVSGSPSGGQTTYQQGNAPIGADVFILGYPQGLASQGVVPIWKRGSIASEPLFDLQGGLPVILVDSLTRHGMSGSPVIVTDGEIIGEDGRKSGLSPRGGEPWLIGVYAGRRGSSQEETEMALGRAWKRRLLDEIFAQRILGGSPPEL